MAGGRLAGSSMAVTSSSEGRMEGGLWVAAWQLTFLLVPIFCCEVRDVFRCTCRLPLAVTVSNASTSLPIQHAIRAVQCR